MTIDKLLCKYDCIRITNTNILYIKHGHHNVNRFIKIPRFYIINGNNVIPIYIIMGKIIYFNNLSEFENDIKYIKDNFDNLISIWEDKIPDADSCLTAVNPNSSGDGSIIYSKISNFIYNLKVLRNNIYIEILTYRYKRIFIFKKRCHIFGINKKYKKELDFINKNIDKFYFCKKFNLINMIPTIMRCMHKDDKSFNELYKKYVLDEIDQYCICDDLDYKINLYNNKILIQNQESDNLSNIKFTRVLIIGKHVIPLSFKKYKKEVDFIKNNLSIFIKAKKIKEYSCIPFVLDDISNGESIDDAFKYNAAYYNSI